ncbi:MAG: hypothetical protein Q4C53_08945 [Clostridia bacterium]|nr:hypothetical protein [Clostridia bacterium]
MTAKEYLEQVQAAEHAVRTKMRRFERVRNLSMQLSSACPGPVPGGSGNDHALETAITALMDAENELNAEIRRLNEALRAVREAIAAVPVAAERDVLEKRYLCFLPWDDIAEDLRCTRRTVMNKHRSALTRVDRWLALRGEEKTQA